MKQLDKYKRIARSAWSIMLLGWLIVPFIQWLGMVCVWLSILVGIVMELKYKCPQCKEVLDTQIVVDMEMGCPHCRGTLA